MARDSYGTLTALKAAVSKADVGARFVSKLKEVDADGDGAVTGAEFCAAVPALDIGITGDEASSVFGLLDIMSDGNLKIDELLEALNDDVVASAPAPGGAQEVLAAPPDVPPAPVARTLSHAERSMKLVQDALVAKGAGLIATLGEMGEERRDGQAVRRMDGQTDRGTDRDRDRETKKKTETETNREGWRRRSRRQEVASKCDDDDDVCVCVCVL